MLDPVTMQEEGDFFPVGALTMMLFLAADIGDGFIHA